MINKIYEINETDELYPKKLLQIKDRPNKIYVVGNIELLNNKSIAIVGSRISTTYGEYYAAKFAKEISEKGITIISGLAKGIDGIAHQNSKQEKGKTIAVLGCGFNHVYPKENEELFNEIIEDGGCIVSQYSPDTDINLKEVPFRNRIISALSEGVLIVEARHRSGSGVTAKYAFEQNKKVFCLPNQIGVTTGVGTNNLIKKGAILVTNSNEILTQIGENVEKDTEKNKKAKLKIPDEYKEIYEKLEEGKIGINELARSLNHTIVQINQKLTLMELEGLIEMLPGNVVQIKD
mgnify:FL=1